MVLDCGDLQAMPLVAGIGSYLADFMGAANAKAGSVMFQLCICDQGSAENFIQ